MSRMFPFITKTWNPIGGKCPHECVYCWANDLAKQYDMSKYLGPCRLYAKELKRNFRDDDFVFVQDMSDLFAETVPDEVIQRVLDRIKEFPITQFLLLTKNPARYLKFSIPKNCVCGATIESNHEQTKNSQKYNISKAPSVENRARAMELITNNRKMVSIEPIMTFSRNFFHALFLIGPEFVAIGYDNYDNELPEPKLDDVEYLIDGLEGLGIKVYRKTLRDPVNNKPCIV